MPCCHICNTPFEAFLSFGQTPISNHFLLPKDVADEYFFELAVGFCPACSMVQLTEQPDRERMFHENYAYFSSISVRMAQHFEAFAAQVRQRWLDRPDPLVVELGSNDGIMLRHFAKDGLRHLGVEPSANVAEAGRRQGVDTVCAFFDAELAGRIVAEKGQADAILAANVMCHIPYQDSVIAGFDRLLAPRGVVIFEDPYLGDIVERTSYDQIYDEHVFYFSLSSVSAMFARHGMEVVDAEPQDVHGGEMRYTIARKGARPVHPRVAELARKEAALGLAEPATFARFAQSVARSGMELVAALADLKRQGKRVVGYGATSKSATVTNYCGIGPDLVEFISDTTPTKQGRLSPGTHIPVRPYAEFSARPPDVALLFAWNHGAEIMAKEQAFRAGGGKWLVYVPKVEIL